MKTTRLVILALVLIFETVGCESETDSLTAQFGGRHPTSLQSEGRALLKEIRLFANPKEIQKATAMMEEYRAKHTSAAAKK